MKKYAVIKQVGCAEIATGTNFPRINQLARSLLFFGLAVCGACLANAREWTIDSTTKVEAEFSGIIGDTVFLSKGDGTEQKVPLASLSAKDQAFIKGSEQTTSSVVTASAPPS